MSNFYIYDTDRNRNGILQPYHSVQWLECYDAAGEVKISAHATADNRELLVCGNRIYNSDFDTVARICHVEMKHTDTEKLIVARANITSTLLDDRVVMATENIDNIEDSMLAIYSNNRRGLPIDIGDKQGFSERADMQITWGSVLDAHIRLAEVSGLGFKVVFDPETGNETFKVYKGVDRSHEIDEAYIGYFGSDIDSVENVTVISDTSKYKNVAVVAGEGEGADRRVRIVSLGIFTGEERRELFVDARDLQMEYQVATFTGKYDDKGNPIYTYETRKHTASQYNALLDARGIEKLEDYLETFSVVVDITQNNVAFGVDYHLGDRIPVKLPEQGIVASARISAVTFIYEWEHKNKVVAELNHFELEV